MRNQKNRFITSKSYSSFGDERLFFCVILYFKQFTTFGCWKRRKDIWAQIASTLIFSKVLLIM